MTAHTSWSMHYDWIVRYNNGETMAQIAMSADVHPDTVRRNFRALGITVRPRGPRLGNRDSRSDWYECAMKMREHGATVKYIAMKLRVSRRTVFNALQALSSPQKHLHTNPTWYNAAVEMRNNGIKVEAIAAALHISRSTVYLALRRGQAL
jgi:transposase-like protein